MKEWYCLFNGKKEGPFSLEELKRHPRFTPDTFVWKKGFSTWIKAGKVKELEKIFKDEEKKKKKSKNGESKKPFLGGEILVARHNQPFFFWLFIIILIIIAFSYLVR